MEPDGLLRCYLAPNRSQINPVHINPSNICKKTKLSGFSPRANYTERSQFVAEVSANFLQIEGATWSAWRIPTAVFSAF
jgi:hypothetical protein